jgi:hypothetical protein
MLLQQQVEDAERPLPVPGRRIPEIGIDDLERAGERQAQRARDLGQPRLRIRGSAVRLARTGSSSIS